MRYVSFSCTFFANSSIVRGSMIWKSGGRWRRGGTTGIKMAVKLKTARNTRLRDHLTPDLSATEVVSLV